MFVHAGCEDFYTSEPKSVIKNRQFKSHESGYQSASSTNSSDERSYISASSTTLVECTCGGCCLYTLCTRGCSNPGVNGGIPLPIWNGTESNFPADSWQFHYESKLTHDTNNVSFSFASLVNCTIESFSISAKVSLKRIILWLKQLKAYKPLETSFPLLGERREELHKAEDIENLFDILSDYWSWYNHGLLENLILEFGGPEDKRRLTEYCNKFNFFLKERLPKSQDKFNFGTKHGEGQKPLLIKVDENWNIPLCQIRDLHYNIARILKVPPHVLYLSSVSKGCICLEFLVAELAAEHAFPLCASQEEALLAAGVFRLEFGEYVWQVCAIFYIYL